MVMSIGQRMLARHQLVSGQTTKARLANPDRARGAGCRRGCLIWSVFWAGSGHDSADRFSRAREIRSFADGELPARIVTNGPGAPASHGSGTEVTLATLSAQMSSRSTRTDSGRSGTAGAPGITAVIDAARSCASGGPSRIHHEIDRSADARPRSPS